MPYAEASDGSRLYYEVFGRPAGEPVLMIQGLGASHRGWALQRRAVGARYRGIVFDNRGAGRSDAPEGPYDLWQMADDALAVLRAAGYESAHVVGASLGGVLAQLLAVAHPDRVRSLVLACTACRHQPWRIELLEEWRHTALTEGMGAVAQANMRWLVGPRSLRRLWPAFGLLGGLLAPLAIFAPAHGFAAQIDAILSTDDSVRSALTELDVPTLVVVGSQDILTPLADSEELAELIPGADLAVIGGAAHGLMVEHARTFNQLVTGFFERVAATSSEMVDPDIALGGAVA